METGITKNDILSQLSKSPHGKLSEYVEITQKAMKHEPEFTAHLIAWNYIKGDIRDSKVAIPLIALTVPTDPELRENSLAHLAKLGPREFLKALRFAKELTSGRHQMRSLGKKYLRQKESDRNEWNRLALQHRSVFKELYVLSRTKPADFAKEILFNRRYPVNSTFAVVEQLKGMAPAQAASEIMSRHIPFLVAQGALGAKCKDPDLVMALIQSMTPTELISNTKQLEKMGIKTNPSLRGAFDAALKKASNSKKNVLKTSQAAEVVEDEDLREKLRGAQERQLAKMGVDGNWLVLGDKSSSMDNAIDLARNTAAVLAKMVKGKVYLVFFNTSPQTFEVTGMPLEEIRKVTRLVRADGWTSIGCGLQRMLELKIDVDGIAIISDGDENRAPYFVPTYQKYAQVMGKEPTLYLYHCGSRATDTMVRSANLAGIDMQVIPLATSVDYYSLPNVIQTMRTNRYSLIDEVMEIPLLTLKEVFKSGKTNAAKSKRKEETYV